MKLSRKLAYKSPVYRFIAWHRKLGLFHFRLEKPCGRKPRESMNVQ